jgi:dynein heavy chain
MAMTQQTLNGWIECMFMFSVIWGLGGCLPASDRSGFSDIFRNLIAPVNDESQQPPNYVKLVKPLPDNGLVFDYCFDKKSNGWISWNQLAPTFNIPESAQFHEIIVPTTDSMFVLKHNYYLLYIFILFYFFISPVV